MLPAVFFSASNGMGIFELDPWSRGGSGRDLPAGPFSTPRFLAAQRSAVSSRREEVAILHWRVNTQGSADPCANPGVLVGNCYPVERFYIFCQHSLSGLQLQSGMKCVQRSDCRAANLQSFAAARHFCSAKILAGGLRWGWGPQRRGRSSRAKKFPEEICFAPRRVFQVCRTPD